ncbi:uncharacterized protein [Hetaerina americana]|uniref:uncharacterized protein n=1 Tax=Hetaerina americana TaxID=62018 RepID=UPI003A7F5E13
MASPRPSSWVVLVILVSASLVVGDETTTVSIQTVKEKTHGPEDLVCFFRRKQAEECRTNYSVHARAAISPRIQQLYTKMNPILKEFIASGSLAAAPAEIFSELHPVVFYLMPHADERLSVGGEGLARYVRARGGETAAIIASADLLNDVESKDLFVNKLAGVLLSERSQCVLGEYLAKWFRTADYWKPDRFGRLLKAGNPLAGSLPSPFLASLPESTIERFLFLLSQWEWKGSPRADEWHSKGKAVTRTWSTLIIKSEHPYPLSNWKKLSYQRYSFLLLGFTPDELQSMSVPPHDVWPSIFQLKFERLQARAVFQVIAGNGTELKEDDVQKGILSFGVPFLPLLSPHQLATNFNHSNADFGVLNYQPAKKYDNPSLATALQLCHCLIAQSMHVKMINTSSKVTPFHDAIIDAIDEPASSDQHHITLESFVHVGRFAYALPISFFISKNISRIHPQYLKDIDANELSLTQARLLTRHLVVHLEDGQMQPKNESMNGPTFPVAGDDIVTFGPGLLRGLWSTSAIVSWNVQHVPQKVIQHMLDVDQPWGAQYGEKLSLRSWAILQKIQNELSQSWVLKHILGSGDSAQILKYLPPQELSAISQAIVADSSFVTLSGLHETTLSMLLDIAMPELKLRGPGGGKWSLDALTPGAAPLLRGMHCRHLELVDPHDVIVVLGHFNNQCKARGRIKYKPFPKNLQNCAIRSLALHLEVKAALWGETGVNISSPTILQTLSGPDIEAVGGFIVAGLPEKVLEYLGADALRLVGELSPQELLLALYKRHHPSDIALVLLKQLRMASDMEVETVSLGMQRGQPKYTVGRLGSKWLQWKGKRPSLVSLLFGSLLQFLPPDLVDAASLKWKLETAKPGDSLVCLDSEQRKSWNSILETAFGPPDQWTGSSLATIGDFLLVVPQESLDRVPEASWANAADTLVENTRYFRRSMETPAGFLSYYEVCAKVLSEAEEVVYVSRVKALSRALLEAVQQQMDSVTPHWKILNRLSVGSSPEGAGGGVLRVPGLRRPSLNVRAGHQDSPWDGSGNPIRRERNNDDLAGSSRSTAMKVTCSAIRAVGPEMLALALKPEDIDLMSPQEVGECVDILGLARLGSDILKMVWMKAKQSQVPLALENLGKIVSVMSLEDLLSFNVTISSNLDAVAAMGREISDWEMMGKLVTHVLPPGVKEPLRAEVVAAMGALLCSVPPEQLPEPRVMFSVAQFVSESLGWGVSDGGRGCPPQQCLRVLAKVTSSWLGKSTGRNHWTAAELASMGILAAGLDAETLASLAEDENVEKQHATLSGLHMLAIDCMPGHVLKSLGRAQILQLSQLVSMRLHEKRNDSLKEESQIALDGLHKSPFDSIVFTDIKEVRSGKEGSRLKEEEEEEEQLSNSEGGDVYASRGLRCIDGSLLLFAHSWSGTLLMVVAWYACGVV